MWRIYRAWRLVLPFLVGIFPEYRTPVMLVHLEFTARHGKAHALFGEVYPSALVK